MSTALLHFSEAEHLLEVAARDVSENLAFTTGEHKSDILAAAQVHATLALAAAAAGVAAAVNRQHRNEAGDPR